MLQAFFLISSLKLRGKLFLLLPPRFSARNILRFQGMMKKIALESKHSSQKDLTFLKYYYTFVP